MPHIFALFAVINSLNLVVVDASGVTKINEASSKIEFKNKIINLLLLAFEAAEQYHQGAAASSL